MLDMPLSQFGAFVSIAISNDENHPASNVIDGNNYTYWMTTGLIPQSLTISFPQMIEIKDIKLTCFKVKNIVVETTTRPQPTDFEVIEEKSIKNDENKFSQVDFKMNKGSQAQHVRFIITEAYDSFVAIQHIKIEIAR